MTNESGILPTEFKVLILPDPTEEVTKGGIIIPIEKAEKEKYATTQGTLVAVSPVAFNYLEREEWPEGTHPPVVGDRVIYTKYTGFRVSGADGKDYLLIADKDIHATLS